ncbi:MAG: type II toxin-antitoxin system RelE/ParE family toxin [Candidatus Rokubacteria bacterium]|nr:type II toxin-antitoxin system RelE/ParE family toxin [Candidatus Rokubacteria bacterium]
MAARIEYKASVAKDLRKLDRAEAIGAVSRLERVLAAEGLRGEALSGEFAGRLRIGDLRVIYARTDEGYLVLRIGHRRDVYRRGRPAE